jgi:carboxylesterase type B
MTDIKQKATWSRYWFPTTDPSNKEDQSISEQLARSWVSFARTGNPNYGDKEIWPRYDIQNDVMREFAQGKEGTVKNLQKDRVGYQLKIIKAMYRMQ